MILFSCWRSGVRLYLVNILYIYYVKYSDTGQSGSEFVQISFILLCLMFCCYECSECLYIVVDAVVDRRHKIKNFSKELFPFIFIVVTLYCPDKKKSASTLLFVVDCLLIKEKLL